MAKEATIQTIKAIHKHPNADSLEIAEILGWRCVVRKGEYKVGDLVVYIEIDSICPDTPDFEFLGSGSKKRIRTMRLRGEISQGLVMPLSILPEGTDISSVGEDVSEILGVKHYEKQIPAFMMGKIIGSFPEHLIQKTDELLIQSKPDLLEQLKGKQYYATVKYDGTSLTCILHNDKFYVCSRRLEKDQSDENDLYVKVARKYNLEKILRDWCSVDVHGLEGGLAIQAEIIGPSIQKNPCGLSEHEIRVFNLFDVGRREYFRSEELRQFCLLNDLPEAHCFEAGSSFYYTIEQLQELANNVAYPENDKMAEGLVFRPRIPEYAPLIGRMLSFKVINQEYLLKHGE